jgi:putative hydrolase of the HAD superfamily
MPPRPQLLLFDLGGVLIDFAGVAELGRLLPAHCSDDEVKARWLACPHSDAFGRGLLPTPVFVDRFLADWGVSLTPALFLEEYRSWARGWLPGAVELLAELRAQFRLAALSNCNPAHWDRLIDDLGLTSHVDAALSSHHLGLRKPDPAIYEATLTRLGVSASDVLFFDDAAANVEAATGAGMQAVVVNGPDAVRRYLVERGWL